MNLRHLWFMALIPLVAIATWMRFYHVALPSFSVDESTSLYFSSYPSWRALFWDNHPPLYHLILKGWLHLFPITETGARSLSILFSVVGVCTLVFAGKLSGSLKRGFIAAILLAGSCLSIRYAQEARMYAAMEAMTCLLLAALFYLLSHSSSTRAKIAFGASAAAAVLTHIFGFIAVLILLPALSGIDLRKHWRLIAVTFIGGSVFAYMFFRFQFDIRYMRWQKESFLLSYGVNANVHDFFSDFGQKDLIITAVGAMISLVSLIHPNANQRRIATVFWFSFLFLVMCAALGETFDQRRIFIARYFIFLNVYFIWCIALGIEVLSDMFSSRWMQTVFAVAIVASFATFYFRSYDYGKPNWRGLAEIAVKKDADLIMSTRPNGFAVPYYSSQHIPYLAFAFSEDFIDTLKPLLKTHKRIFIADDDIRLADYQVSLLSMLTNSQIRYETFDLVDSQWGSVFGVLIYGQQ